MGIVVNKLGHRFYDEGEDLWPKRYAIWGRLVAQQPDQIAYSIIDSKSMGEFMPSVFPPIEANSIRDLARKLELDAEVLERTVSTFNESVGNESVGNESVGNESVGDESVGDESLGSGSVRSGSFDLSVLDDCATQNLDPPKSHWALPLDTPPYYGYPLRPGITFTYLGVTVDEKARVIMKNDRKATNIFAAGEIMAGNILGQGYLAGLGMTIGTVFGRIAGREAARHALG